jgi:hypothetical protein
MAKTYSPRPIPTLDEGLAQSFVPTLQLQAEHYVYSFLAFGFLIGKGVMERLLTSRKLILTK